MDKSMGNNEIQKGEILLQVKNLKKYYPVRTGFVKKTDLKAVDDVSFFVRKGETLGIVGESGCGKTTLGRTVLRLEEPTSGDIIYENESIIGKDMKEYRKKMQIVFQDPYASLDPRKTVSDLIGEAMDLQKLCSSKDERRERVLELMKLVGLNAEFYNRFPHEFSGGQRQRIGIARALAVTRDSLSVTSRYLLWMCLSRRRSSICWKNFRKPKILHIFLLHMTWLL